MSIIHTKIATGKTGLGKWLDEFTRDLDSGKLRDLEFVDKGYKNRTQEELMEDVKRQYNTLYK